MTERVGCAATDLLEEMIDYHPEVTSVGKQNDLAFWISNHVQRAGLGNVTLQRFNDGGDEERTNIIIEAEGNGTGRKETLLAYGHYDVTQASRHYEDDEVKRTRKPNEVYRDPGNPHILYGHGTYDMLGGVASILAALHDLKIASHRKLKIVLCGDEEGWSRNVQHAIRTGVFDGVHAGFTPEILVNNKLRREGHLAQIEGRPGRYSLKVSANGLELHTGAVLPEDQDKLSDQLVIIARDIIREVLADLHRQLCPQSPAPVAVKVDGTCIRSEGITTPGETAEINVHYFDRSLRRQRIRQIVHDRAQARMRDLFTGEYAALAQRALTIALEERPPHLQFAPVWPMTEHPTPFSANVAQLMTETHLRLRGTPGIVQRIWDTGTADCPRLAVLGFPFTGIPPVGWNPHRHDECVDERSLIFNEHMTRRLAIYPGNLTDRAGAA